MVNMDVDVEALKSWRRDAGSLPRIALDIDSTWAGIDQIILDNFNKAKGTNFTIEDHTDWDFKNLGSSYVEMMPFYVSAWVDRWKEIPFLGDLSLTVELTKDYYVSLLTTRSPTSEGVTGGTVDTMHEWIRLHGIDKILPPAQICDPKQNKAKDFDYDAYIDDSPRLADTVMQMPGKIQFLVDQRYNREVEDDGKKIIRVQDANHAMRLLIEVARGTIVSEEPRMTIKLKKC